ncbi:hypothetical protein CL617_02095 [archaeon]|nr:hypothetical protein [archaeon]|tara:strand:- start:1970 stop:2323 length:354 start_codon:yes stop_codon:yes gene_type:complete
MNILKDKEIIVENVKYCDSLFSRAKGLMFSKELKDTEGLILVSDNESIVKSTIHTFFCFYSMDVLWLNKDLKVVDKKENLKPFKLSIKPKKPSKYVLELKNGKSKDIKIGDRLTFIE